MNKILFLLSHVCTILEIYSNILTCMIFFHIKRTGYILILSFNLTWLRSLYIYFSHATIPNLIIF